VGKFPDGEVMTILGGLPSSSPLQAKRTATENKIKVRAVNVIDGR
jgi:hypothetical protein